LNPCQRNYAGVQSALNARARTAATATKVTNVIVVLTIAAIIIQTAAD
jgi:hypothetical protein